MVWAQAYNIQGQSMKKGDRSRPFVRVRKGLLAFLALNPEYNMIIWLNIYKYLLFSSFYLRIFE